MEGANKVTFALRIEVIHHQLTGHQLTVEFPTSELDDPNESHVIQCGLIEEWMEKSVFEKEDEERKKTEKVSKKKNAKAKKTKTKTQKKKKPTKNKRSGDAAAAENPSDIDPTVHSEAITSVFAEDIGEHIVTEEFAERLSTSTFRLGIFTDNKVSE